MSETSDSFDNIRALIHDDDSTGTQPGLSILQGVVVHANKQLAIVSKENSELLTELPRTS